MLCFSQQCKVYYSLHVSNSDSLYERKYPYMNEIRKLDGIIKIQNILKAVIWIQIIGQSEEIRGPRVQAVP